MSRRKKQTRRPAPQRAVAAPETPSGPLAGRAGTALVLGIALVLVVLAYSNAVQGQFVYDDQKQIVRNPLIQNQQLLGKALTSDVWAFSGPGDRAASNYWRPLFIAWLSLHYSLFGMDPAGWHATNIGLHFLATLLGFFVLRSFGARPEVCAAVTWLFAVSPVHVESVTWISGSPDPMVTCLLFAAYLGYAASRRARRWLWRTVSLLFFCGALLCKETAIVFPAIVFAAELVLQENLRTRRAWARAAGPALKATVPFLGVAAVYLAVRASLVGLERIVPPGAPGIGGVLLTLPSLLVFYLRHAFWPFGLGPSYPPHAVSGDTLSFTTLLLPLLLVAAVAWGAVLLLRRGAVYRLALPWLVFPLAPVLDIRSFVSEDLVHDRYLYLPLFGALAFAASAAAEAWTRLRPGRGARRGTAFAAAGLVLAALLVPATRSYNRAWMDEVSLWERGVRSNPETAFPHAQLGEAYRRAGRFTDARRELERALALNPGITTAHLALAALAQKEGRLGEAEQHLHLVLAQYPDLSGALDLLGIVYQGEGRLDDALAAFERSRRAAPALRAMTTVNIAIVHKLAGRSDLARRELESLLGGELETARDPNVIRAWWFLGELSREAGEKEKAIAYFERYLAATDGLTSPDVAGLRKIVSDTLDKTRSVG
jgi:protein O-mannosyl-transferase